MGPSLSPMMRRGPRGDFVQLNLTLLSRLYYGRARRVVRAALGRLLEERCRVQFGPLRGAICEEDLDKVLGIYELHVQEMLKATLTQGDVVYDVGGHHGYHSVLASKLVGDTGKVYVFEPLPENCDAIARVVSANDCGNCTVLPVAVSDRIGQTPLFFGPDDSQPSILTRPGGSLMVETTTLDDFAFRHQRPNLVKVDVEGAEYAVLLGARQLLGTDPPITWVIELHTNEVREAVRSVFDHHGYRVEEVRPAVRRSHSGVRHIIARRYQTA
jgi:FkbM family methyltransferase